jgi:hypothetical protein
MEKVQNEWNSKRLLERGGEIFSLTGRKFTFPLYKNGILNDADRMPHTSLNQYW